MINLNYVLPLDGVTVGVTVGVNDGVGVTVGVNDGVGVLVGVRVGVWLGVSVGTMSGFKSIGADLFLVKIGCVSLDPVVGCPFTINLDPFAILPDLGLKFSPISILLNLQITNHMFDNHF